MIHVDTSSNFHPFECDGAGKCVHCDRAFSSSHDPRTCALCDPEYDMGPPAWRGVYPGYCRDLELCRGLSHCPREFSCVD